MTLKIPVWKELIADRLNSKIFQQAAPGLSPEHRALVWGPGVAPASASTAWLGRGPFLGRPAVRAGVPPPSEPPLLWLLVGPLADLQPKLG